MLGLVAMSIGRNDLGLEYIGQALAIRPTVAEYYGNYGLALARSGRGDQAMAIYQKALALRPDYPEAHHNLGNALDKKDRWHEAIAEYRIALALRPEFPEALADLGASLHDLGEYDEAIAVYQKTLALDPKLARAHLNMAIAMMLKGDLRQGFEHYDWRWDVSELGIRARSFEQPIWDGSDLAGRRILLHAEQGFGDVIQMVRYVPAVAARGGEVWLECRTDLHRTLKNFPGIKRLIDADHPNYNFDLHCPMMSLPRRFQTTLETIPADIPYLRADPALAKVWRARFSANDSRLRVGLVWAGSAVHYKDRRRSMPLSKLAPLANVPGVQFYMLQKGPPAEQASSPPPGLSMIDWTGDLNYFADTAGLLENLDLIVTADTSVVHLAGAMGKPAWVFIPYVPDWRWMLKREDSPWYPSLRLFRQEIMDDWQAPIDNVARELTKLAAKKRG
jgi:hypothetical protein